jgi:hypothetical protein
MEGVKRRRVACSLALARGAAGDEVPEQHLVHTYSGEFESELLAHSSRLNGATLLGDADLRTLSAVLQALHTHFMRKWRRSANAVDVEFLIMDGDRARGGSAGTAVPRALRPESAHRRPARGSLSVSGTAGGNPGGATGGGEAPRPGSLAA